MLRHLQHNEEDSIQAKRLAFASMSRALWFNNVSLAKRLLQSSELAKLHLCLSGGKVSVVNPAFFNIAFNQVHVEYLQRIIRDISSQIPLASTPANLKKQYKARIQCYRRLSSTYWTTGKRLAVTGIKVSLDDGTSSVAQSPAAIQHALKEYWGSVYSEKVSDVEKANKFLDLYARRNTHLFEFSSLEPASEDDFGEMVMRAKHSACDEDGVPYAAFKANSFLSAKALCNSFSDLASRSPITDLTAFNKQIVWFAPKGASHVDRVAVIRTPNNLRTIFGSNCDSKLISGTISHKLVGPMLKVTPQNQRGFCKGRQLSLNTVDLDLFTRLFNSKVDISKISMDKGGESPCFCPPCFVQCLSYCFASLSFQCLVFAIVVQVCDSEPVL